MENVLRPFQPVVRIGYRPGVDWVSIDLPCEVPLRTCVPHALTAGAEVRRPAALPACIAT